MNASFQKMVMAGCEAKIKVKLRKFLTDVYHNTPKSTGLLAGNWQISQVHSTWPVSIRPVDQVLAGISHLNFSSHFPEIFIFNNVPYVGYVENGTRYMTGYHMLQQAIAANF